MFWRAFTMEHSRHNNVSLLTDEQRWIMSRPVRNRGLLCLLQTPPFSFSQQPTPKSPPSSSPPQGPDLHSLSTRLTVAMATAAEQAPSPIAHRSLCKWYPSLTVTACKIILHAHRQVIKLNFRPVDRMSTAHEWSIKRRAIAEDDVGSLWEHMTVKGGVGTKPGLSTQRLHAVTVGCTPSLFLSIIRRQQEHSTADITASSSDERSSHHRSGTGFDWDQRRGGRKASEK